MPPRRIRPRVILSPDLSGRRIPAVSLHGQPVNLPWELQRSFVVPKSGTPQDDILWGRMTCLGEAAQRRARSALLCGSFLWFFCIAVPPGLRDRLYSWDQERNKP
jgi:hypothetical protein